MRSYNKASENFIAGIQGDLDWQMTHTSRPELQTMARNIYENGFIDGKYEAIKHPLQTLWLAIQIRFRRTR